MVNSIGVMNDHDTEFVRSITEDVGVGNDNSCHIYFLLSCHQMYGVQQHSMLIQGVDPLLGKVYTQKQSIITTLLSI